jgi:hypothetical protein
MMEPLTSAERHVVSAFHSNPCSSLLRLAQRTLERM